MMETPSPIAIVGIGARLPGGVDSACSLWDLLVNKRDGRGIVPPSRYNIDGFYKGTKSTGTVASKYGYFLQDDIAGFDGSFFSMSKLEVDRLDPQQRMLLEVVWECMESGGQKNWRGGNVGCYVGVFGDVSLAKSSRSNMSNHQRIGWIWVPKTHKMLAYIESPVLNHLVLATESATNMTSRAQGEFTKRSG
jgi:acyl transferase domain-containing protein